MSYYYNRYSGVSSESQWKSHLQNQSYVNDISSRLSQCSREQVGAMRESAQMVGKSISAGFDRVSRQMEKGFEAVTDEVRSGFSAVNDNLEEISGQLDGMSKTLESIDWRMSMMIEEQKITNILSENIALLLRIPEFQKERQHYIEHGLKFLKNARKDGDFYNDALSNFLKAEEKDDTDYFLLQRIGMIYQYVPALLDIKKAEGYFRKAAKYAFAESHPDSARLFNILSGNMQGRLASQSTPEQQITLVAAESYFHAGVSCYTQGKFDEAIELTGNAYHLVPDMLEAGFAQAKALAAAGKPASAVPILNIIITTNSEYSEKTANDIDLATTAEVRGLLDSLRNAVVANARQRLEYYRGRISKEDQVEILKGEATDVLNEIQLLIDSNTYMEGLAATRELLRERKWKNRQFMILRDYLEYETDNDRQRRKREEEERLIKEEENRKEEIENERKRKLALHLIQEGIDEEYKQDKKWISKDYKIALNYFEDAREQGLNIGNNEITSAVDQHIAGLKKKMK